MDLDEVHEGSVGVEEFFRNDHGHRLSDAIEVCKLCQNFFGTTSGFREELAPNPPQTPF